METSFILTGGSWRKSPTVITERSANAFSRIIKNNSPNLESISVHKLLETKESSSTIKHFNPDDSFLKLALHLSFKSRSFVPGLILRPELMMAQLIFTGDTPIGQKKKEILAFLGIYSDEAMLSIGHYILLSPTEIYLYLHCLKEIYFELKEFISFAISPSGNILATK